MEDFNPGKKIMTAANKPLEILQKLGEGGQGVVYKVRYDNRDMALKWYFPNKLKDPSAFYANIANNIKKGAPSPAFLWPQEITEKTEGSFGYLMNLRPPEYVDFSQFLLARTRFKSIGAVINAALLITEAFMALHRKGLSYQDMNDGNFFVNPESGGILICDNDNVCEYGENSGIAGKCRYMAPEIVLGKNHPDPHTDRFSLAVVLYMFFFLNHPLEGAALLKKPCLTEELERHFYGENPVFVYDPNDNNNRPVRGVHTNEIRFWPLYPGFVRELFQRSFSRECMIGNRQSRVLETDWIKMLVNLRGLTAKCPYCGNETFITPGEDTNLCINCKKDVPAPLVLRVKRYSVAVWPDAKLYACHTRHDSDDFKTTTGEIITSAKNPGQIGLRNRSGRTWVATLPNGISKEYGDGKVIRLGRGLKIDFGNGNAAEIV